MEIEEAYALLNDAHLTGESGEILAAEYAYLLALLMPLTEWAARQKRYDTLPTVLELLAALIPSQLPEGAAPSLRDTLHALDGAFAEWQAEETPARHWQARQIAKTSSQIALLLG